jgi:hypothetical protein
LDRRTDGTAANDLAKGAERGEFLGGLQRRCALASAHTDAGNAAVVVMKDFGRVDVNFTREQHADNQGAYPGLVPYLFPASQIDDPLFLTVDSMCPLNSAGLL